MRIPVNRMSRAMMMVYCSHMSRIWQACEVRPQDAFLLRNTNTDLANASLQVQRPIRLTHDGCVGLVCNLVYLATIVHLAHIYHFPATGLTDVFR